MLVARNFPLPFFVIHISHSVQLWVSFFHHLLKGPFDLFSVSGELSFISCHPVSFTLRCVNRHHLSVCCVTWVSFLARVPWHISNSKYMFALPTVQDTPAMSSFSSFPLCTVLILPFSNFIMM